jgi:putative flippase GtrA
MKSKQKAKNWHAEIKRLLAYSVTGGAWFWSGYLAFAVCDQVFGLSLFWAKLIANLVGITVNFILERIWVFDRGRKNKKLTVVTERYFILTVANLFIDYLIVRGLQEYFGLTPYLGQFVSAGFFFGWNYLWYKYWVFAAARKATRKPRKRYA